MSGIYIYFSENEQPEVGDKNIKMLMKGRSMIRYEISDQDESEIQGSELQEASATSDSEGEGDKPENKRKKHSPDETENFNERSDATDSGLPPELEVKFPQETTSVPSNEVRYLVLGKPHSNFSVFIMSMRAVGL